MSALRDAFLSAVVALGLFGPMVGLVADNAERGLTLRVRPIPVAVVVGLVFFGRLAALSLRSRRRSAAVASNRALAEIVTRAGKYVAPLLLVLAVALPFSGSRYYVDLGTLVLTYIMLGWGLNIVVGLAGLLDLGYVAFYAVGAYSYAILAQTFGLGFWTCLPLAGILAALWGILLGFPVLRLRGDYLAIVTLAFGEIIRIVITNWVSLTNGPNGISGIPRPTLFGLTFSMDGGPGTVSGFFGIEPQTIQRVIFLYYVILGLALITNWVTLRLRRMPQGRAWEALREDEVACRSLGINVTTTKLTAFAMGAMFGGFAGAFFATRQAFISPESFTFIESATVLAIVVLGGLGSQLGVALAAIIMVGGLELLRQLLSWMADQMGSPLFAGIASALPLYRMLIFGVALVLMMVLRPRGLVSGRTPTASLGKPKEISAELVAQGRG
ncbi:MAG TPA: high-affinity branched-chain amino acid ABC transporter permease LivM [Acetobacteraceae bacterium]|nr:high-affinity branched-chain amino acid ABC transporter permease LivM [Acetobacteraceae bacterium]